MRIDASGAARRVDLCVTTMDRPQALERLLLSIAAHFPDAPVHIADQSKSFDQALYARLEERLAEAGLLERLTVHRLPHDCGIAVGRNHLIDSTSAEYRLSLDDDFVFTERTDISGMVRLLDTHPEAGLIAGAVRQGQMQHRGTRLERRGDSLCQLPLEGPFDEFAGVRIKQVDCVPLFVLMRRELFSHLRWDSALKTGGAHFDFFLRMKEVPLSVLYTPDISIDHPHAEADPSYSALRLRGEFLRQMMVKHELRRIEAVNGTVFAMRPDGELTMYCELS